MAKWLSKLLQKGIPATCSSTSHLACLSQLTKQAEEALEEAEIIEKYKRIMQKRKSSGKAEVIQIKEEVDLNEEQKKAQQREAFEIPPNDDDKFKDPPSDSPLGDEQSEFEGKPEPLTARARDRHDIVESTRKAQLSGKPLQPVGKPEFDKKYGQAVLVQTLVEMR